MDFMARLKPCPSGVVAWVWWLRFQYGLRRRGPTSDPRAGQNLEHPAGWDWHGLPQGLKPGGFWGGMARLKPCPFEGGGVGSGGCDFTPAFGRGEPTSGPRTGRNRATGQIQTRPHPSTRTVDQHTQRLLALPSSCRLRVPKAKASAPKGSTLVSCSFGSAP
jgi:hypothetical protein